MMITPKKNQIRNTPFLKTGLILCLILAFSHSPVQAQKSITWMVTKQIPFFITEGEYKGKGANENVIRLISSKALPDFNIEYLLLNHNRFNIEAKKQGNCYFGWKTFPSYRIFSMPASIMFPKGVIINNRDKEYFGPPGKVLSLKNLIENNRFRLGVISSFAYAPEIQLLLKENKDKANIYFNEGSGMEIDLRMLSSGRIDYTIGWPTQPIVSEKLLGIPNEFIFYNIKESQKYFYLGISCSTCETGKLVIERVNALFKQKEILRQMLYLLQQWAHISKQHQALFDKTIIKGQPDPMVVHMKYPE